MIDRNKHTKNNCYNNYYIIMNEILENIFKLLSTQYPLQNKIKNKIKLQTLTFTLFSYYRCCQRIRTASNWIIPSYKIFMQYDNPSSLGPCPPDYSWRIHSLGKLWSLVYMSNNTCKRVRDQMLCILGKPIDLCECTRDSILYCSSELTCSRISFFH